MDDPRTDDRPRRRRRSTKPPLKITSDLPDDLPVTDAEVRLMIWFMGDRIRRILEGRGINQPDAKEYQPMEELDYVRTRVEIETPDGILPAGTIGTIVTMWAGTTECLVEFEAPWHVVLMRLADIEPTSVT